MFNDMFRRYSFNYNNKLLKLLQPWQDNLAITHFCTYQLTTSGHYNFFGSHLPFTEYFYSEKLYQNCPFLLHPDNYKSGISLSKCIPDPFFQNSQNSINNKFNMDLSLTIIEKNAKGIRGYAFASKPGIPYLDTLYLNEIPLFQLFIRRFKEEFKPVLAKLEHDLIDLGSLIGKSFFTKKVNPVAKVNNREKMLKMIGVDLPPALTNAEKGIVKEISKGYTAKEIGEKLHLSKRTVEHYLESLKGNFNCSSKSHLVKKAQELSSLGYFD